MFGKCLLNFKGPVWDKVSPNVRFERRRTCVRAGSCFRHGWICWECIHCPKHSYSAAKISWITHRPLQFRRSSRSAAEDMSSARQWRSWLLLRNHRFLILMLAEENGSSCTASLHPDSAGIKVQTLMCLYEELTTSRLKLCLISNKDKLGVVFTSSSSSAWPDQQEQMMAVTPDCVNTDAFTTTSP